MGGDILQFDYCFLDEFEYNAKAFQKRLIKPEAACGLLEKLNSHLADCAPYDAATIESSFGAFCDQEQIKPGDVIHALRVATTGSPAGFGMFETLAVLGKDTVAARIQKTLEKAKEVASNS